MPDLRDQIRDYFDEIDPPFTLAELMRKPHRTQHPHRIMTARAFILAAGAAALVLLLIGGPILLLRGSPDVDNQPMSSVVTTTPPTVTSTTLQSPPTTTPNQPPDGALTDPTPTVVVPAVPPTPPQVLALSGNWDLAYIAEGAGTVRAALVTPQGQLLLAGMGPHLALSSDGGATWEEADPSGTVRSQAGFLSGGAATNGDVVVVAGRTCEMQGDARQYNGEPYESFPCPQEPGLWATSDLQNWARVDLPERIAPSCVGVSGECYSGIEYLIGGSYGFLATGTFTTDSDPGACTQYEVEQLVLTSHDGISWTNQAAPQPAALGLPKWQSAWDDPDCHVERTLVPLGRIDGRWLTMLRFGVGFETEPADLELDGSVIEWSSDWGQYRAEWQHLVLFDDQQGEWSLAGPDLSLNEWPVAAPAPALDGLILGGSSDCDTVGASIWTTTDGLSFDNAFFEGRTPKACVSSISASDFGYLAILENSELWYSSEAKQWHSVDLPKEIRDPYLVASSDIVMVFGWTEIEVLRAATVDDDGNDTYAWMTEDVSAVWIWQTS